MKRSVTITLELDPTEYHEIEDTPNGTIDLVIEMLRGDADLPDSATISCEGITRKVDTYMLASEEEVQASLGGN